MSKPSETLKYVNGKIADLEDDLQHYTMVEKDKCIEFFIREDLKQFTTIKQTLLKAQKQEKALEIIIKKNVDVPMLIEIVNTVDKKFACDRHNQETNEKKLTKKEFELLKEVLCDENNIK